VRPAAEAVAGVGPAAATPEILAALAALLRDRNWEVRKHALAAVGGLGPAAATPEILAALAALLRHSAAPEWAEAARAVGSMGPAAATPEFLVVLVRLLRESRGGVRPAVKALTVLTHQQGIRLFFRRRWFRRPTVIARTLRELGEDWPPVPEAATRQPPK
jgi:HEAT repeat protein